MNTASVENEVDQARRFEWLKHDLACMLVRDDLPYAVVEERLNQLEALASSMQTGGNEE